MTSSSHSPLGDFFSPQRILLFLPIAIGAGVAVLLLTAGAAPLLVQRQQEEAVWKEMRTKREDLPLIVQQLNQQQSELLLADQFQEKLVDLVAGTGQLRTVLAAMNSLTELHNVQITALELKPLVVYVPPPPSAEPAQGEDPPPAPPPSDPLRMPPKSLGAPPQTDTRVHEAGPRCLPLPALARHRPMSSAFAP